jgi:hypothetical protein
MGRVIGRAICFRRSDLLSQVYSAAARPMKRRGRKEFGVGSDAGVRAATDLHLSS